MNGPESEPPRDQDGLSPLAILRDLQNGELKPSSLSIESRRACIEHLIGDGYSVAEAAQVLSVSVRTVHRDVAAIQQANAIEIGPTFVAEMAGRLFTHANQSIQRLRRISRERDTDAAVRVEAERAAWTILKELAETFQRLGYLPTVAQQVRADIVHRSGDPPTFEELQAEATRVTEILQLTGGADEVVAKQLAELQELLSRSAVAQQIGRLQAQLPAPIKRDGEHE